MFVWGTFFNERIGADMTSWVVWLALVAGFCLVMATAHILRQREPKSHEVPRGPREAKPWDNPKGSE